MIRDAVAECESEPDVPVTTTGYVPAVEVLLVVIVVTTATEAFPGVTGFGVNLHCAPEGIPLQESVTALANDSPTGSTLKL
jgi:hypothetical protein